MKKIIAAAMLVASAPAAFAGGKPPEIGCIHLEQVMRESMEETFGVAIEASDRRTRTGHHLTRGWKLADGTLFIWSCEIDETNPERPFRAWVGDTVVIDY